MLSTVEICMLAYRSIVVYNALSLGQTLHEDSVLKDRSFSRKVYDPEIRTLFLLTKTLP